MTYIISHDFGQSTSYYVRVVDEATFDEVYSPEFATQFKSKKKAQEWIDVSSSMKSHSKVVDFDKSVQKYKEWVEGGTVSRTLACINRTMSRKYNNEPLEEVIDWWVYAKTNDHEIDFEDYKTWPKIYSLSKHLWEVSIYCSRDHEDYLITFEIYTRQDGNFDVFQRELNLVLDKVTYKDEDGFLILPIFDHYLSEGGNSVSLLIHPETNQVKIERGRHNIVFASLEDAFDYMKSERYYE